MLKPWKEDYKKYKEYLRKDSGLEDFHRKYLTDKIKTLSKTIPRFQQNLRRKIKRLEYLKSTKKG